MVRAGKYRHFITIKSLQTVRNDSGQPIEQESILFSDVPANITDVGGGEIFRGQQIEANITTVVETRYLAGVTATAKIEHDGRTLNIDKVLNPDGIKRTHFYHCTGLA